MRLGMEIANKANRVLSALRTRAFSAWADRCAHSRALSATARAARARLRTGRIRARFHAWRVAAVGREAERASALPDAGELHHIHRGMSPSTNGALTLGF